MKIAILCTAFLALLQVGLALSISRMRWKYKLSVGVPEDSDHPMCRVRTAFSNCAEWHPTLIALMVILQMGGGPSWSVWLSPLAVAARYCLVLGLVTFSNKRPNMARFLGALGTYLSVLLLAVLILVTYWPNPAVTPPVHVSP